MLVFVLASHMKNSPEINRKFYYTFYFKKREVECMNEGTTHVGDLTFFKRRYFTYYYTIFAPVRVKHQVKGLELNKVF